MYVYVYACTYAHQEGCKTVIFRGGTTLVKCRVQGPTHYSNISATFIRVNHVNKLFANLDVLEETRKHS